MKITLKSVLAMATVCFFSQGAFSAECVLTIDRVACPGKEFEALQPYDGKNPTVEKAPTAKSEASCILIAEKSSKILRKGTLIKKTVFVSYDGKDTGKIYTDTASCK